MWPRGVETKEKMTLERQVKANHGELNEQVESCCLFHMYVCTVRGRLELCCND